MRLQYVLHVLLSTLFVMAGSSAHAQVDPTWDHYKGYLARPFVSRIQQVTLADQFQTRTDDVVQYLDFFANPVEKRHGTNVYPINRPELHYTWWVLSDRPPIDVNVVATNQFGEQRLHVGGPSGDVTYLLNPALKNAPSGTPLPVANHYKCYPCTGDSVNVTVALADQFFARDARVLRPRWFCAPVEKRLQNGTIYPILEPRQHYTIYEMDYTSTIFPARISDQFITDFQAELQFDPWLMVPTLKEIPTAADGTTTWGRVKSQYR